MWRRPLKLDYDGGKVSFFLFYVSVLDLDWFCLGFAAPNDCAEEDAVARVGVFVGADDANVNDVAPYDYLMEMAMMVLV